MEPIDVRRSALIVMDYQNEIIRNYASDPGLTERAARAIAAARRAGLPVVYVQVAFSQGHVEVGPESSFAGIKKAGRLVAGTESAAIHPAVAPLPGDVVITKKRVGAFGGGDFDLYLRGNRLDGPLPRRGVSTGVNGRSCESPHSRQRLVQRRVVNWAPDRPKVSRIGRDAACGRLLPRVRSLWCLR